MKPTVPPGGATPPGSHASSPARGQPRLWFRSETSEAATSPAGEQFDALTDLFLGEVAVGSAARPGGGPVLRLAGLEDDDEAVAEPAEAPARQGTPQPRPVETPVIETLLVGNLPVSASMWASQYVRELSHAAGRAVASIRVQAGYVTVALVGGDGREPAPGARPDAASAIEAAARLASRWVVQLDGAEEMSAAARRGVGLVTLVTGADEIARVSAAGTLKELAARLAGGAESPRRRVRVAVMGTEEPAASEAAERIAAAGKEALGREIEKALCSPKIRAMRPPAVVFSGKCEHGCRQLLDLLEQTIGLGAASESPGMTIEAEVAGDTAAPDLETDELDSALTEATRDVMMPEPAAVATGADESESEPAAVEIEPRLVAAAARAPIVPVNVARVDDVKLWAAASVEPKVMAARSPGLASHVAGLESAEGLACPYAAGVEFAMDAEGRLHALVESGTDQERALGLLMVSATWAEAHRSLLAAVVGRPLAAGAVVKHLFTATPRQSRRLLETDVKVHVLAAVRVGEQTAWYSTELN